MRRWVQLAPKTPAEGPRQTAPRPDEGADEPGLAPRTGCATLLTCIFHGLELVHGTQRELLRSTATARFVNLSSPSRFV